ncbi:hypothetical protein AMJ57_04085 [Parcubacteria bacterium SG8_24]|nr:MAG: hypothetical protein AMJ57_04085 [Parcubacteria bacterium SG8_24]
MSSADLPEHLPVLLNETVDALDPGPGENVVDCTVGGGGHAAAILERTAPDGRLLGLDLDEAALEAARRNLERFGSRVMLVRGNYRDFEGVLLSLSFGPIHAALLDLGFSSMEIDDPARGFSFRADGPLDMRYDRRQELTAAAIVNGTDAAGLASLFRRYGEERYAPRIAAAIVKARRKRRIVGTLDLAEVVTEAVPASYRRGRVHPATRVFQALRIAVNDELGNLTETLPKLVGSLEPGGRLAVISFHSLEDRIVKRRFREMERQGELVLLNRRPIVPGVTEVRHNPRARSAKLRAVRKK